MQYFTLLGVFSFSYTLIIAALGSSQWVIKPDNDYGPKNWD